MCLMSQNFSADKTIPFTEYCLVHLVTAQSVKDGNNIVYGFSKQAAYVENFQAEEATGVCSG